MEETKEKRATKMVDQNEDTPEWEESEPYLGPAWAVVILIIYVLKQAFPAKTFSLFWWFQMYVVALVVAVTIFTLIKRHQFYKAERRKKLGKKAKSQAPPS